MMRPNHEFFCSVALSPGFRNWVEMTCTMQQEAVGLVFLPRLASLVRAPVLPCAEAPLGESVVLLADAGAENPRVPLELMCVCVCVCVCVPPNHFKSCSNCEVQQLDPASSKRPNHEFRSSGAPSAGCWELG